MEWKKSLGELAGLSAEAALDGVRDPAEEAVRRQYLLEQQRKRRKEQRERKIEQEARRLRSYEDDHLQQIYRKETRSPEVRAAALRVCLERNPSGKP